MNAPYVPPGKDPTGNPTPPQNPPPQPAVKKKPGVPTDEEFEQARKDGFVR